MSSDLYSKASVRAKHIAANGNPQIEDYIDEIVSVSRRYHMQGLDIQFSARSLVEAAFAIMIVMTHLDDSEAFARHIRDSAETTRKIISEHWPPPDPAQWPSD